MHVNPFENETKPLSEYETLSLRLHLHECKVQEQFDKLHTKMNTSNASLDELVSLFKGAKTLYSLAGSAGKLTIKFSAFVVALGALVAMGKYLIFGGTRP